jgi:S1-C subfamily serine protease
MRAGLWLLLCVAACAGKPPRSGTCFFVSHSGLALTSFHLVRNAHRIFVIDSMGRSSRVEVVERDERLDLAAIQTYAAVAPWVLPVAIRDPAVGDRVFAIRALKQGRELIEGSIVLQRALGQDYLVGASLIVERGESGGPLVNDRGEVVGVMVKRRNDPTGAPERLSFAVKASDARRMLGALPLEADPPPGDRVGAIDRARRASCFLLAR